MFFNEKVHREINYLFTRHYNYHKALAEIEEDVQQKIIADASSKKCLDKSKNGEALQARSYIANKRKSDLVKKVHPLLVLFKND